jgi:hypothetical protein
MGSRIFVFFEIYRMFPAYRIGIIPNRITGNEFGTNRVPFSSIKFWFNLYVLLAYLKKMHIFGFPFLTGIFLVIGSN